MQTLKALMDTVEILLMNRWSSSDRQNAGHKGRRTYMRTHTCAHTHVQG